MDRFSVRFFGSNLNVEELLLELKELTILSIRKKGDVIFWTDGKMSESVRGLPFEEHSLDFQYDGRKLYSFLDYLCSKKVDVNNRGIEQIEIWAFLERSEQINGEISFEEITMLKELGASYCWSVI